MLVGNVPQDVDAPPFDLLTAASLLQDNDVVVIEGVPPHEVENAESENVELEGPHETTNKRKRPNEDWVPNKSPRLALYALLFVQTNCRADAPQDSSIEADSPVLEDDGESTFFDALLYIANTYNLF